MSEQVANGLADTAEMTAALSRIGARGGYSSAWAVNVAQRAVLRDHVDNAVNESVNAALDFAHYYRQEMQLSSLPNDVALSVRRSEVGALVELVRDIFGNPFRPVALDSRWLSSNVLDLARTIYDERVWERMPILADALMDAGCDSEEIIQHCQGPGPHARGCWVVDLLLAMT